MKKLFGDGTNLRGALVGMLLGAMALSACLGGCADEEIPTTSGGTSGRKPDLPIPSFPGTGATSKGGAPASPAAGGSAPGANGDSQPPAPNPACTENSQCASGFCVDGVCCNEACDGT